MYRQPETIDAGTRLSVGSPGMPASDLIAKASAVVAIGISTTLLEGVMPLAQQQTPTHSALVSSLIGPLASCTAVTDLSLSDY